MECQHVRNATVFCKGDTHNVKIPSVFLDEDYIKAISEKVGHRVAYKDGYFGLFTKQMFQKWRSEAETMYNELFE